MKHFSSTLSRQVDDFIDTLEQYNAKRPRPRRQKDYDYLRRFFKDFLADRNKRSEEVESVEYKKALSFASKQFPVKTMFNLCIDGRVLAILAFGVPAALGPSLRIPGGMVRDFIRGTDGRLKLEEESMYGQLLRRALENYELDLVAEVYDSHVGCAARLGEEQLKGRQPEDSGLMADVSHKKQIADATKVYFQQQFAGKKSIIPIQTSFDPHTGYLYMGLEISEVFAQARRSRKGFTHELLTILAQEGKIISTELLAQDQHILQEFRKHLFTLDWKENYTQSTERFWHAIAEMKPLLSPHIEKIVLEIYPHLAGRGVIIEKERETRVLLLLTNAFSGFLHNYNHSSDDTGSIYPYGIHKEEGIKISEGGYPPYKISMFVVFSLAIQMLPANVDLSAVLVRNNRREGRVVDRYGLFTDSQEFTEASVPIIAQEIIRDLLSNEEWKKLEKIDWSDMPINWEKMSSMEFMEYIHKKGNFSMSVVLGINNLRKRMAALYNPIYPTSSHLIEHYKVALPVVTGRFRKHHFILPFVKLGFE